MAKLTDHPSQSSVQLRILKSRAVRAATFWMSSTGKYNWNPNNRNTISRFICIPDFFISDIQSVKSHKTFPTIQIPEIFEMAAMPFRCNGIWVDLGNLPRILLMYYFIYASFPIPYFNL